MSRKTKRTRSVRKHKRAKMGGGLFDFLGTSNTNTYGSSDSWLDSFTKGASEFWNQTKKSAEEGYKSITEEPTSTHAYTPISEERKYIPPASTYVPPPAYTQQPTLPSQPQYMTPFGGKRVKKSRRNRVHMRGGYTDYTPTTGIAMNAAPFSGYTAQPQVWVGGKTKRRKMYKKNRSNKRRH